MTRLLSIVIVAFLVASCGGLPRRTEHKMPYEERVKLASIYIQSNRVERAVPLLKDAVSQDPERPEAHAMLGEILFLQGDLEGSRKQLTSALKVGGDDPLVLNNLAWIEMNQGHAGQALDLIERALRLNPAPIYPYLDTRSRVLLALGRRTEALSDARAALRQVPEHDAKMRNQLEKLIEELEGNVYGPGEE